MRRTVAILSVTGDPHAAWAAEGLRRAGHRCHVLLSDRLADEALFSWSAGSVAARVSDAEGVAVQLEAVDSLWWRRSNRQAALAATDPDKPLVDRCAASTWIGGLLLDPGLRVIDDPYAVFRAENKLAQLAAAKAVGLDVPQTLVSNDPEAIRRFARDQGPIIAKTLRHAPEHALETVPVAAEQLQDDDALRLCPAIYQSCVPGEAHLRLLVFGQCAVGVTLRSPHLDWRGRKELSASPLRVEPGLAAQCQALLCRMGLSMAVFDFKLGPDGPVFFEFNPQGQFLFMEILSQADWSGAFAEFLATDGAERLARAG